MKQLLIFAVSLLSTFGFAQDSMTSGGNIQLGFGYATSVSFLKTGDFTDPYVGATVQLDLAKSNFTIGPEVRGYLSTGKLFPNIIVGGITGYDNGKFRFLTSLATFASGENDYKPLDISVYRGIHGIEIGYGRLFLRADYYTNLKTYYYSGGVQIGVNIKF